MPQRIGEHTIGLASRPSIIGYGAHVGKKESEGPLRDSFTSFDTDTSFGQDSWEKAESALQRRAFDAALAAAGKTEEQIQLLFGGDLLNQCIATGYAACESGIPFAGLYGACSTMAESLAMAAVFCDAGAARLAAALTSSHFCSAERQFRFPLEYGGMRAPASQWTVTGSGCALLSQHEAGKVCVERVTFGAVRDLGVCDINNMGAAMAPAASDTLARFFRDTGTRPGDYDAVFTGDLGLVGSRLLPQLLEQEGYPIGNHADCGCLIFDAERQGVKSGGSGCGCSAAVLCAHLLPKLERGELRHILFVATGALMSTTSFQQGSSIPGVAHLCELKRG